MAKPKTRKPTPARISQTMRSDGLVLRVGSEGMATNDAFKLARRIVRDELPGHWVISSMGTDTRDFIVRRPTVTVNPTVPQAFDFAYKLQLHRQVEDAEPSLIMPNTAPQRMEVEYAMLRSSTSSSSGGGDSPLPCSGSPGWAIELCQIPAAWSLPPGHGGKSRGDGIVIGHPDTGYTDHPELDSHRVLTTRGRDFEQGDADPRDTLRGNSGGHGTSTGSVIMSGEGPVVSGVAPMANLVPLRVTTNVVLLSFGKLAEAIRFAADDGHHVLSISLGGPLGSRFLHRAVQHAIARGVIVVAAAGNVWPFVVYPAKLDEVIAVAACNCNRGVWSGSASGAAVDMTAPGESVWRAWSQTSGFSTARSSGTSYATAITAGAAALWLAHHGRSNLIARYGLGGIASVFKELLVTRGFDRPSGWDTESLGPGILNVKKLLQAPLPTFVAAGGMRAIRTEGLPRRVSQVDDVVSLFPNDDPKSVRANLAKLVDANEINLATRLRDVGDEVAYYAVMNTAFRSSIASKRTSRTNIRAAQPTALPEARMPTVSKKLKKMMK